MKPLTAAVAVATAVALSIGVAGAQNGREIKQNRQDVRQDRRELGQDNRDIRQDRRALAGDRGSSAATGKPDGPTRSSRTAPICAAIGASFARTFATAATTCAT